VSATASSTAPSSKRRDNVIIALLVLAGLAIGAGGIAAYLSTKDDSGSTEDVGANVQIQGTLPTVAPVGVDPAVGQPAPTLSGVGFDGTPIAVPNDGLPHAIFFVAHWCPHCQASVQRVMGLSQGGFLNGVGLYTVATATSADRPNYPPSTWLQREQWPFPTIADTKDNQAAGKFGVTGLPFWVFVDRNGKVAARISGELPDAQVATLFRALAQDRPLPVTYGGGASPTP
jgi:Redoxin